MLRSLSESETAFTRLAQTRTLREIYTSIPVLEIAPLEDPASFANWSSDAIEHSQPLLQSYAILNVTKKDEDGRPSWHNPIEPFDDIEPLTLARRFEAALDPGNIPEWMLEARRQIRPKDSKYDRLQNPHTDNRGQIPHARIYVCASENPTYIISHGDSLLLLEKLVPRLLDLNVMEKATGHLLEYACEKFKRHFHEAGRQVKPNIVYGMTGATIHFAPVIRPDRVFSRAIAHAPS